MSFLNKHLLRPRGGAQTTSEQPLAILGYISMNSSLFIIASIQYRMDWHFATKKMTRSLKGL